MTSIIYQLIQAPSRYWKVLTFSNFISQVYFGAADTHLDVDEPINPMELDIEILGNGTLMCFMIVTPMILLAYAVEGRKTIQATSLDALFSFAGAALLIAVGGILYLTNICKDQVSDQICDVWLYLFV